MSTAASHHIVSGQSDPWQHELRKELRHISDLVFIRDLLRERGETSTQLRAYDAVIDEARAQLAYSSKRVSARFATAA